MPHRLKVSWLLFVLPLANGLLLLCVLSTWLGSGSQGATIGEWPGWGWKVTRIVDGPAALLVDEIVHAVAESRAPSDGDLLTSLGVKTFPDLLLRVYWPLLFVLGTLQWLAIRCSDLQVYCSSAQVGRSISSFSGERGNARPATWSTTRPLAVCTVGKSLAVHIS